MPRKIDTIVLSDEEKWRIVGFLNTPHIYFKEARNACIASLLYYSGLKTHQLSSLDQDSYIQKTSELKVGERRLKLNPLEEEIFNHYLKFRNDKYKPLFISLKNHNLLLKNKILLIRNLRLTDRSVQRIVKEIFELLKINKNIRPKDFRHRIGIKLATQGATHKDMQKVMGNVAMWARIDYKKLKDDVDN